MTTTQKDAVLKIGNASFTTKRGMTETLFTPIDGKTAAGFYQKRKRGILFSRPSGEPWFFLVANKWGERFFISCGQVNGKTFYMHAMSGRDESLLGIDGMKYSERQNLAAETWESIN